MSKENSIQNWLASRKSENLFEELLESAPDAVLIVDNRGKIVLINAQTERLFGYKRIELIGQSVERLLPERFRQGHLGLRTGYIDDPQVRPMGSGLNLFAQHKNGSEIPVEISLSPLETEAGLLISSTIRDITPRVQIEKELRAAREELEVRVAQRTAELDRFFSLSLDMLCIAGLDGYFKRLNPAWESTLTFTQEELTAQPFINFVHPDDQEATIKEAANLGKAGHVTISFENRYQIKGGEWRWLLWSAVGYPEESLIYAAARDITERKQMEEDLKKATDKALEADRLKSAFLASMSHELRTPLNSIIGFTGALLRGYVGPIEPEQEKLLKMVAESSHHLLALINDVLDISKIEADQIKISKNLFSFPQTVEKTAKAMREAAKAKGLSLSVSVAPEIEAIHSDLRRVEQILLNLVNNAIKFTDQGEIKIIATRDLNYIETKIIDTGIGIKPDDLDKLFKPFVQVDTGLDRIYEGTGLGLSICKKLVNLLGGEIWVESKWGSGSTFTFTLPIKE